VLISLNTVLDACTSEPSRSVQYANNMQCNAGCKVYLLEAKVKAEFSQQIKSSGHTFIFRLYTMSKALLYTVVCFSSTICSTHKTCGPSCVELSNNRMIDGASGGKTNLGFALACADNNVYGIHLILLKLAILNFVLRRGTI